MKVLIIGGVAGGDSAMSLKGPLPPSVNCIF